MWGQGIDKRVKILKFLMEEGFSSGERIAKTCGISRGAVWKHIRILMEKGVEIKIHPNKGYQFVGIGKRLLPELIWLYRNRNDFIKEIIYFDEIDSTNEYAKQIKKEATLIIAEDQKKGKGRKGSRWYSEKLKDLLFSLTLRPHLPYSKLPLFNIIGTLAVGIAVRKLYGLEAKTKWPNDVLLKERKFCGVLVEFIAELDVVDLLILGIGVNVNSHPKVKGATSILKVIGREVDRLQLLIEILSALEKLYDDLKEKRFKDIQDMWKVHSFHYDKEVAIEKKDGPLKGKAKGIDENGISSFR
jgi:BirA family biotin operon repressor/biotin-[acetyl-CoA-carboxylase] ligase